VVMPAGDHDRTECFADQVKLSRALVGDLDEAIMEVKLLTEHEEESSQKITELEALCKRLREDAQKLKEENTKVECMVESHDEIGLDRIGGDAATPLVAVVPSPTPTPHVAATPEEIIMEEDPVEMVPEQKSPCGA
jgi:hypothetical protein